MSDEIEYVEIAGGHDVDNAVLLLDAAEAKGYDQSVVRTTSFGFRVPKDVAEHAGLDVARDELADRVEAERAKVDEAKRSEPEAKAEQPPPKQPEAPAEGEQSKKQAGRKATADKGE